MISHNQWSIGMHCHHLMFINISVVKELFYVLILVKWVELADQKVMVLILLALMWLTTVILVSPEKAPLPVSLMDSGVKNQLATVVWILTSKVNNTWLPNMDNVFFGYLHDIIDSFFHR